jgi:hypothetical protein
MRLRRDEKAKPKKKKKKLIAPSLGKDTPQMLQL